MTRKKWKLSTTSNLALITVYLVGSLLLIVFINFNGKRQALEHAERYSGMILDRNVATHAFFNNALKTSLYELLDESFFEPDWMSSTFAINSVAEDYAMFNQENLYYKESSIGARNPANEADLLEKRFIEELNKDSSINSHSEIFNYEGEPYFVVLKRGQQVKEDCLLCHGDPADAPQGILEHYGPDRGFNRKTGETISAITIRIPLAMAYQNADQFSLKLSLVLLGLLLVIFATQYIISRQLLFAPIDKLHKKAHHIAENPEQLGETLPLPRGRELANMVDAFNQMSETLRRQHDNMEETIRDRTMELEATNLALIEDIEKRETAERSVERLSHRNEMILNTASEGILGLDTSGRITFYNNSAAKMLTLVQEDIGRARIIDFIDQPGREQEGPNPSELIDSVLLKGAHVTQQEVRFSNRSEFAFPAEFSCAPIRDGDISGAVFSFNDITERKHSEEEIQNLAFYDQLTKLPNRTLFYDRISQRVAQASRDTARLALMFLDLDDFKMVNDTLGHAAGDEFLKVIAIRLQEHSRTADTVARLGGDEFVWFGDIVDEDDAAQVARKFLEAVARPVRLGHHNFTSTVSIGIAVFPDNANDVVGLLKCADSAMYQAKQNRKNAFRFCDTKPLS